MAASVRALATLQLLLLLTALVAPAQVRVACLGDSITFGARIEDRAHSAWPVLLGHLLGKGHVVRNFGVGGATWLRAADAPFAATPAYRSALAFAPDVAVIALGTNDTCDDARRPNFRHEVDLERDARAMVAALRQRNAAVRVLLCAPTAMFPDVDGLTAQRRANLRTRAPRLDRIAAAARAVAGSDDGVEFVDLRPVLRPRDVVDGVHPNPFGCERIARRIAFAIQNRVGPPPALAAALRRRGFAVTPAAFDEFTGFSFALPATGARCRVVQPHGAAVGLPWILRARFFGHQPALDLALLRRGFHLLYCDVSDLYGAPAALARWDEFYALLRAYGFAQRGVLEGMSRGGLPIVNWAARHPERVAAIYGDNPVADFRSWPGGHSGKRSEVDWQRCLAAYDLDESSVAAFRGMPVDRLEPLARASVPLLLVLGTADEVVPPRENGELLASRMGELGGVVQVWRKPGCGHHPHGLHPVDPLLRAVLQACGMARAPSVVAVPSVEYRRGAGWPSGWWQAVQELRELASAHAQAPIVFLGDSITQGLTGHADRVARAGGRRPFDRAFGDVGAVSLGLSGDRTEHLLFRIRNGALPRMKPQVVVVQIGVNNIQTAHHTPDETAAGIAAVVAALRSQQPQATVLLCGPFPVGTPDASSRRAVDEVHLRLRALADGERVRYRDLRGLFLDARGAMNDRMRPDRVHITAAGQQAWLDAIDQDVRAARR